MGSPRRRGAGPGRVSSVSSDADRAEASDPAPAPAGGLPANPAADDTLERRLRHLDHRIGRIEMQVSSLVRHLLVPDRLVDPRLRLSNARFALHSQFEEDGITLAIHEEVGPATRRFVELGCGPNGGNSGVLAAELGWGGLMVDAHPAAVAGAAALNPALVCGVAEWVTVESVNDLLRRTGSEGPIDHLGIDLDGNDYWVWAGIDAVDPRVVVVEFNSSFGPEAHVTIPYDPEFRRPTGRGVQRLYFGASLQALVDLGMNRGYRLVAVEPHGANAFFVKQDLAPMLPTCDPLDVFRAYERHLPHLRRGNVVGQLKAAGLPLMRTSEPGRAAAAPALTREPTRDEAFDAIGGHAPYVGVSTGAGDFLVSTNDQTVARSLFVKQSRGEMGVLRRALDLLDLHGRNERRVLLDVGANIGTTTVTALTQHGFDRAIAFEPAPANVRLLRANIALNGLVERVVVRPVAVSGSEEALQLLLHPFNSGGHEVPRATGRAFEGGVRGDAGIETISVEAVAIDDELVRLGVDGGEVGLLWLDVQGHEGAVLEGATKLVAGGVPLVTEFHPQMLRHAGTLDTFLALVTSHYRQYVDLRPTALSEPVAIAELAGTGADLDGATGRSFTDILLLS